MLLLLSPYFKPILLNFGTMDKTLHDDTFQWTQYPRVIEIRLWDMTAEDRREIYWDEWRSSSRLASNLRHREEWSPQSEREKYVGCSDSSQDATERKLFGHRIAFSYERTMNFIKPLIQALSAWIFWYFKDSKEHLERLKD